MGRIGERLRGGPPSVSFEFFPPKSDAGRLELGRAVGELMALQPDFVSVTYGAGGSDRHRTGEVVSWIRRHTDLVAMPHLTCQGHTRNDVARLIVEYRRLGITNLLALGGDPPADGSTASSDYRYAVDLIDDVASSGAFSIGVAAHPEVHPRSPDRASARRHLAAKLGRADFAITQFFFDVDHYRRLVDELSDLGVEKPIVPGVMPVASVPALRRMAGMNGTEVPDWLGRRLEEAVDVDEVRRIGRDVAAEVGAELLEAGAPGLHLYTLNRPETAKAICEQLGLHVES